MTSDIYKIYIEENDKVYEIFSIYLSKDGSFKIDLPYCRYVEKGLVMKLPVYYRMDLRAINIPYEKIKQKFYAIQRPQLSIHASGLVQFSGIGIRSGINRKTGEIKGVGLRSAPLSTPVQTGPTFGVNVWGLSTGYRLVEKQKHPGFLYKNKEFTLREFPEQDGKPNSYLFEVWIFPSNNYYSKLIRKNETGEEITLKFPNYLHSPGAIFTMDIIRLRNVNSFMAILPFFVYSGSPKQSDYGFQIGGPTERIKGGKNQFSHIVAFYPGRLMDFQEELGYLDYQQK